MLQITLVTILTWQIISYPDKREKISLKLINFLFGQTESQDGKQLKRNLAI